MAPPDAPDPSMDGFAFLGAGNMAAAMVDGLIAQGAIAPTRIACMGGAGKSAESLARRTGVRLARTLDELMASAGTLVVAFKPQHLATADVRLAPLTEGRLVVSVLAGKTLKTLFSAFPHARALIRSMPNTPGRIGAGMTGWCSEKPLGVADRAILDQLLAALGQSVELEEDKMDAFTAVSGSGPAYVFEFAAALRDAGEAAGLPRAVAESLATETLLGASRLLAREKADPEILRNQVTSPNGVTAAGLRRMSERQFRALIRDTVLDAKARAEELSK